jgi:hypothetical protein
VVGPARIGDPRSEEGAGGYWYLAPQGRRQGTWLRKGGPEIRNGADPRRRGKNCLITLHVRCWVLKKVMGRGPATVPE